MEEARVLYGSSFEGVVSVEVKQLKIWVFRGVGVLKTFLRLFFKY